MYVICVIRNHGTLRILVTYRYLIHFIYFLHQKFVVTRLLSLAKESDRCGDIVFSGVSSKETGRRNKILDSVGVAQCKAEHDASRVNSLPGLRIMKEINLLKWIDASLSPALVFSFFLCHPDYFIQFLPG